MRVMVVVLIPPQIAHNPLSYSVQAWCLFSSLGIKCYCFLNINVFIDVGVHNTIPFWHHYCHILI